MGVLDGQVAIVTGAGQGVGRGIALAVSYEGAKVMVLGGTVSKCEAVVEEITARGGQAVAQECDVESREQIESSVQRCVERWGRIDLLVNNASSWTYESIRRTTDDEMETMWKSGPMASFRFMQSCFLASARFPRLRREYRVGGVALGAGGHRGVLDDQGGREGLVVGRRSRVGTVRYPGQLDLPGRNVALHRGGRKLKPGGDRPTYGEYPTWTDRGCRSRHRTVRGLPRQRRGTVCHRHDPDGRRRE